MSPDPKVKQENYSNFGGINQKASLYLTPNNDVLNLQNYAFTYPGALNNMPGSAQYVPGGVAGPVTGIYEYTRLEGASYLVFTANTNAYYTDGVNIFAWRIGLQNAVYPDFTTFTDFLFMTDGLNFITWNGTDSNKFSAPDGALGMTFGYGLTVTGSGFTGNYVYAYGYQTNTGYYTNVANFVTVAVNGTAVILTGFTYPIDYGISSAIIYRSSRDGTAVFQVGSVPFGGQTFIDAGLTLGDLTQSQSVFFTLAPRFLEIYQNSLFLIGSSQFPSTAFFSDLGAPESIQPTYNFEVRTNNGDFLTGGKFYNNSLYLFKRYSFYRLSGTDPTNFQLYDTSDQYGCLSHRAIVVYQDYMLFLDRKGIALYNGAQPSIISQKIEETFLTMNQDAALNQACAFHNRLRNEIWWAIPTEGSTINNTIVVFDYISNAWTVRKGIFPSSMGYMYGDFDQETVFFGGYTGTISYCSASLYNDAGNGMTYIMQSKFFNMGGPSSTMQYRRLFIDTDPIGSTVMMTINFRKDENASIVLTRTIQLDQFQTRIDFGIPAKSLSVEFIVEGASFPIKLNGFTVEARLQRKV